jgi:hypothetical protein
MVLLHSLRGHGMTSFTPEGETADWETERVHRCYPPIRAVLAAIVIERTEWAVILASEPDK